MQQLHLVGFTTDLDSLIFSGRKGAKSGSFVLPLDEHLLATIAEAVRRRVADGDDLDVPIEILGPAAPTPRRQSQLSPREIQDRLRAGRSLEAIAAEAGVGEEWVARFAAPVDAERSQVVGRARDLVYTKPRRGPSGEPLGLSVRWNLADRGVRLTNDEFDDGWSAYQIADHAWMVTFTFVSRKRTQQAEWEVDLAAAELLGRNRLASDLGYVEPGRRRRSMSSLQPMPVLGTKGSRRLRDTTADAADDDGGEGSERVAVPASARRAGAAGKNGAPRKAAVTSSARGATVKKATASRSAAKKAPASGSAAKKASAVRPAKRAAAAAPGPALPGRPPAKRAMAAGPAAATNGARRGSSPRAPAKKAGARAEARPAPAKRTAKASRKAGAGGRSSAARDVPPAAPAPAERPVPNELGQRRLQIVTGAPRPTRTGRPAVAAPPAPPRLSPVRIAARRSTEAVPAPAPSGAPVPAAPEAPPAEPVLDVDVDVEAEDDAAGEARRTERRAARAAARAAATPPAEPVAADLPPGDGRLVTIRANRAVPPTGDGGDVILPPERPPLRPAQPAAQPRRRRFGRTGR